MIDKWITHPAGQMNFEAAFTAWEFTAKEKAVRKFDSQFAGENKTEILRFGRWEKALPGPGWSMSYPVHWRS